MRFFQCLIKSKFYSYQTENLKAHISPAKQELNFNRLTRCCRWTQRIAFRFVGYSAEKLYKLIMEMYSADSLTLQQQLFCNLRPIVA